MASALDAPNLDDYLPADSLPQEPPRSLTLRDLLDISPVLTEAAGAIVDDSFTRCFKSNSPEPWNWNIYLFPLWCLGVVIRYGLLFPLRFLTLVLGWMAFFTAFFPVHFLMNGKNKLKSKIEVSYFIFMNQVYLLLWIYPYSVYDLMSGLARSLTVLLVNSGNYTCLSACIHFCGSYGLWLGECGKSVHLSVLLQISME
ncbi:glycerol-3-phosphate acyltransferase 4 [Hordeum vulgare]|nr:glycerol-3-phosphate acyltransferase 4 [Hordeum vulgare]